MKIKFRGLALAWLIACSAAMAGDLEARLRELTPTGVVLTEIEETDGVVRLVGEATGTDKVSALMRAIDQSDLGSPELVKMKRTGTQSNFVLRIRP